MNTLEQKITDAITPVIQDEGFALVQVSMKDTNLQILIEDPKTGRLGIDDCTKLTREISTILDVEDFITNKYTLEVSSPGIDRPLIKKEDFIKYEGFDAKIETALPNEMGQKRFRGILAGMQEGNILLSTDQGDVEIEFESVKKAKLVLTDELIKKTATM